MLFYHVKICLENLLLTNELKYYHFCSQAELTIEGVDDKEEFKITDVSSCQVSECVSKI